MLPEPTRQTLKPLLFTWEGKDKTGQLQRGELRAANALLVHASLRRRGIVAGKVTQQTARRSQRITEKDIAVFTRQLATMLKAGIPLLQAFDIVGHGLAKPALSTLVQDLRAEIASGSSLQHAFRQYPRQFNAMYCNLVGAGEQAGILDTLLVRLARDLEKSLKLKSKIKSAFIYPSAVLAIAVIVTSVIMLYVVPAFKEVFSSFGATLPWPTLLVIALSDWTVRCWPWLCGALVGALCGLRYWWRHSRRLQHWLDATLLGLPLCGPLLHKASTARWSRTLAAMFAAGVPLADALHSVGAAAGSARYRAATLRIQSEVSSGASLTLAMHNTAVFPPLVIQMVSIGEQSGALDAMLDKAADFYEEEVEQTLAALLSMLEPALIALLGLLIGALVVALYLPIFKLGSVL